MCEFLEDLEPYIEERIQTNYKKLKKSKKYRSKNQDFNKKFDYLFDKLEKKDKAILEDCFGLINDINAQENYLAYEIGFVDGIKLNDYIEKNRN